ncbi:MAG: hypothetical protein Ct9H300mP1_04080 [Planctomycetaceae bacterium]|nr:MAG: hypothetical protein Ct9H300mP1_04080 [Planctomycetaceae bacterium]
MVLSTDPHRLACLANRGPEVRAAVVSDVGEASRVSNDWGPTWWSPVPWRSGKRMSRQIVEICLKAAPPESPIDWPDGKS